MKFFFDNNLAIRLAHGNKGQAIPGRDMDTARERMRDWVERNA